jgi:hypothetical protein
MLWAEEGNPGETCPADEGSRPLRQSTLRNWEKSGLRRRFLDIRRVPSISVGVSENMADGNALSKRAIRPCPILVFTRLDYEICPRVSIYHCPGNITQHGKSEKLCIM